MTLIEQIKLEIERMAEDFANNKDVNYIITPLNKQFSEGALSMLPIIEKLISQRDNLTAAKYGEIAQLAIKLFNDDILLNHLILRGDK